MQKYLEKQGEQRDFCKSACKQCTDCKRETRGWCSSACDECNRCYAKTYHDDLYTEPYHYRISNRTLKETPALSKQFCDNICGQNMCNKYKQRLQKYHECKMSQPVVVCNRMWGCPNPEGAEFGYVAPSDPMYSDCKPCW